MPGEHRRPRTRRRSTAWPRAFALQRCVRPLHSAATLATSSAGEASAVAHPLRATGADQRADERRWRQRCHHGRRLARGLCHRRHATHRELRRTGIAPPPQQRSPPPPLGRRALWRILFEPPAPTSAQTSDAGANAAITAAASQEAFAIDATRLTASCVVLVLRRKRGEGYNTPVRPTPTGAHPPAQRDRVPVTDDRASDNCQSTCASSLRRRWLPTRAQHARAFTHAHVAPTPQVDQSRLMAAGPSFSSKCAFIPTHLHLGHAVKGRRFALELGSR